MSPSVFAVATMDTKGQELDYVADCMRQAGISVVTVDVGSLAPPTVRPDVTREELAGSTALDFKDRAQAIATMGQALTKYMQAHEAQGDLLGMLGIGGSGGTALITQAMRAMPIGLPKVMVSTMASGDTAPYVDCSDISMMFSVVDIAGLNQVSKRVLANAAHAMAGMVRQPTLEMETRPTLGMTMFGVTTPCVTSIREQLEQLGYDCLVFHATGTGGRAMEKLVASGLIQGVLDITTTEVADYLIGGVFPCGPERFCAMLERGIPLVLSVGAVDMVNFGALETVPEVFRNRRLHVHNSQVTLMRTTVEENRQIAQWMAAKLNRSTAPLVVLLPEKGVSALDAPGQPFEDPTADAALFEELAGSLVQTASRRLVRLPYHINDRAFAQAAVEYFQQLVDAPR